MADIPCPRKGKSEDFRADRASTGKFLCTLGDRIGELGKQDTSRSAARQCTRFKFLHFKLVCLKNVVASLAGGPTARTSG